MTKRSHVDLGMDVPDLLSRMRGSEDASVLHEVTCYQWWNSHEGSATHLDRRFASRRMALLYTAKMNSEELIEVASSMSKGWGDLFPSMGVPALHAAASSSGSSPPIELPNMPFELTDRFLSLSDDALQEYNNELTTAFYRLKVPKGSLHRYTPRESSLVDAEELLAILQKKGKPPQQEHVKRQLLLLSDIAGFD